MEIKDAISLYNFLGQLGWLGSIALIFIITLITSYLIITVTDKLTESLKKRRWITIVFSLIILLLLFLIVIPANIKREKIDKANAIKSYMVSTKYNWNGFREIAQNVSFSADEPSLKPEDKYFEKRVNEIKNIVTEFPDEFSISRIDNLDKLDTFGVELIDSNATKVLNKYFEELVPFMTLKIKNYMFSHKKDTLSYYFIRKKVDYRCQEFFIDMIVNRNVDKFIPVDDENGNFQIALNPKYKSSLSFPKRDK